MMDGRRWSCYYCMFVNRRNGQVPLKIFHHVPQGFIQNLPITEWMCINYGEMYVRVSNIVYTNSVWMIVPVQATNLMTWVIVLYWPQQRVLYLQSTLIKNKVFSVVTKALYGTRFTFILPTKKFYNGFIVAVITISYMCEKNYVLQPVIYTVCVLR